MNWMKAIALVSVLALPLTAATWAGASAAETVTDTKTATKKPTKEQLSAYEAKCSSEANAKGLLMKNGKGEERKTFRAACIKKLVSE